MFPLDDIIMIMTDDWNVSVSLEKKRIRTQNSKAWTNVALPSLGVISDEIFIPHIDPQAWEY